MRLLLKILAWVIILAAGVLAVSCVAVFGTLGLEYLKGSPDFPDKWTGIAILMFTGGLTGLCTFCVWRALVHLRQPDAETAADVVTMTIYLLFFSAVAPLLRALHFPGYIALAALIGTPLVRRYLIKRIVPQAFPVSDIRSTSIATGAKPCGP